MSPANSRQLGLWVQAARPWTLGVGVTPVLLGIVIAHTEAGIRWLPALAALLGAILIQVGTNLANDYFDFRKGADHGGRVGPQRVTQAGLIPPEAVRRGFILTFSLAFLIGIYLVAIGGMPIVIVGLLSLLLALLYTGGPFPLAYHGLAELPAFLFFGPIASATTTYVQTLTWSPASLLAGISAGFFSMALLAINNLRDHEEDRKVGKNTLIARFGRNFGVFEYSFSLLFATLTPLSLALFYPEHSLMLVLGCCTLMALHPIRSTINHTSPAALLPVLKMTAKLEWIFTFLFILVWLAEA